MSHIALQRLFPALLLSGALMASTVVNGQVSITSGSAVTQNFNGIGSSATATLPSGFKIGRSATTYGAAGTATEQSAGTTGTGILTGTSSGGAYNFANGINGSSTDRAVGFLTTGSAVGPGYLYMQLQNNTGVTISDLSISFDYEKFRSGTRAFTLSMQSSTDGSTFGSDIASGGQAYSSDASNSTIYNPPTTTSKSVTLTGVNIANGASYYIRWKYAPTSGSTYTNAQAIGIDNVSVTATIGCSGTPSHATAAASPTSLWSGSSSTLSLSGYSSGAGITYQWQSSATGATGSYSNISGATNTSYIASSITATKYYRCYTRCTNSGLADTSNVRSVTVISASDTIPSRDNNLGMGNPSNAAANGADSNNYLVSKSQFALSYNNTKGMANWVSWHLSRAWKGTATRCDCFTQDATLPTGYFKATTSDYTSTGFDRGHLCPSDDRDGSDSDNNATFKMTNIAPQAPILNQQVWGDLEDYCRKLANQGNELYIIAGGYGSGGTGSLGGTTTSIASGDINVPSSFWKVILVLPVGANDSARADSNTRVIAVNMPNIQTANAHTWDYYRVSVDSIEALTGLNVLSNITDYIENYLEAKVDDGAAGLLYWDFTGTNNIATMGATDKNENLDTSTAAALSTLTRGSTAPASTGAACFRTTGFKNEGISVSNTDYYQVKVKARPGYRLSITGIDARFSGTSTFYASPGVASQYAYSTNGSTFTLIGSPVTSTSLYPATVDCSSITALQNLPDTVTVYLRYYASGRTNTGGWGFASSDTGVSGLVINGTAKPTGARPAIDNTENTPVINGLEVRVMPNPFTNDLKVSYQAATTEPVYITVMDMRGAVLYTTSSPLQADDINLPIGALAPGNYILFVQNGQDKAVHRLIKQ